MLCIINDQKIPSTARHIMVMVNFSTVYSFSFSIIVTFSVLWELFHSHHIDLNPIETTSNALCQDWTITTANLELRFWRPCTLYTITAHEPYIFCNLIISMFTYWSCSLLFFFPVSTSKIFSHSFFFFSLQYLRWDKKLASSYNCSTNPLMFNFN